MLGQRRRRLTSQLRIDLLGDFRVSVDDAPVTGIDTPRLQSLLAFLVLHSDAPQSRPQLS
jgi:DNA-binding SARP family transcriptional activator